MKIGDEVFVRGYVDEIRKDCIIIRNDGGYFGTEPCEVEVKTDNPQYVNGYLDALNEIMKYSYGMLDAEKFGLQHKVQSMIWDFMGDKVADTPQTERCYKEADVVRVVENVKRGYGLTKTAEEIVADMQAETQNSNLTFEKQTDCEITDCDYHKYCKERGQTDCGWK